jgi:Ca-activated chloride channel family protein
VFLSVLGFGTGNFKDSTAEKLANEGNGNYAYIDSLDEARKVLVSQMGGTLVTVAKDVKIQVEFNPAEVTAWRLIGYENRVLAHQDFNDDTKDAGEIGAGLSVTALYELVPRGVAFQGPGVDPLKYQDPPRASGEAYSGELLNLKLRYKEPEGTVSRLLETQVRDSNAPWPAASDDFKFAAAVAAFAMHLRGSEHLNGMSLVQVRQLAAESAGDDPGGYRRELLRLIGIAEGLKD